MCPVRAEDAVNRFGASIRACAMRAQQERIESSLIIRASGGDSSPPCFFIHVVFCVDDSLTPYLFRWTLYRDAWPTERVWGFSSKDHQTVPAAAWRRGTQLKGGVL